MPEPSRSRPRRYTRLLRVLLSERQLLELRAKAAASDRSLSATVRQILDTADMSAAADPAASLACLVAVEQGLLLLRDLLPEGFVRAAQAREQAVLAAEWRLAEMRESLKVRS